MKEMFFAFALALAVQSCCKLDNNVDMVNTSDAPSSFYVCDLDPLDWERYMCSVKGHEESGTIVGDFTGQGLDTLFLDSDSIPVGQKELAEYSYDGELDTFALTENGIYSDDGIHYYRVRYFLGSNNPALSGMNIDMHQGLVYEGDLDGDGKDEWGSIVGGMGNSQYRSYCVYNFDTELNKWRYLYDGDLLGTELRQRASYLDLIVRGPQPGTIVIRYSPQLSSQDIWGATYIIKDTIVEPTYTPIKTTEF